MRKTVHQRAINCVFACLVLVIPIKSLCEIASEFRPRSVLQRYIADVVLDNLTYSASDYSSNAAAVNGTKMWQEAARDNGAVDMVYVMNKPVWSWPEIEHNTFILRAFFGTGACGAQLHKERDQEGTYFSTAPPRCTELFRVDVAAKYPFTDWRITSIKPVD